MADADIADFLRTPRVCIVSVEQPNAAPLAVPTWYGIDDDSKPYIWTTAQSAKVRRIAGAGRLTLTVQKTDEPYAYVSVEGITTIENAARDDVRALVARYVAAADVEDYLDQNYTDESVVVRVEPTRIRAVDFS